MAKVLLAVEGARPSPGILGFALEFCRKMKAELSVLQFIRDFPYREIIEKNGRKIDRTGRYIETSLMAAAFAEAGEHDFAKQLLSPEKKNRTAPAPDNEYAAIPLRIALDSGESEKEIAAYIENHPDVTLTIFDAPEETDGLCRASKIENIRKRLNIPLVCMKR